MERVKLKNSQEFKIITNGVLSSQSKLVIRIISENNDISVLEELFSNETNTSKIYLLSDTDEILKIYSEYVKLTDIGKQKGIVIGYEKDISTYDELLKPLEPIEPIQPIEPIPILGDLISITLEKRNEIETKQSKLRSDVDYIAMINEIEL